MRKFQMKRVTKIKRLKDYYSKSAGFFVMLPYKGKQISSRRLSMLAGWLAIGEFSKCPKQIYGSSNSIGIRFSELASSGVREQYKKHVGHVSHGQKRFLLNNYRER